MTKEELLKGLPNNPLLNSPRQIIECVIENDGMLFGSSVRKLINKETDFTDFDIFVGYRSGRICLEMKKKPIKKNAYLINGYRYHIISNPIESVKKMTIDIDLLGLSKEGLIMRDLTPSEAELNLNLEDIIRNVQEHKFSIYYPDAKKRYDLDSKLEKLTKGGYSEVPAQPLNPRF